MKKICLLGASGSIGQQTIDVMKKHPQDFLLVGFSVGHRTRKISSILKQYPDIKYVCVQEKLAMQKYQKLYPHIHFYYGNDGLLELIKNSHPDMVVNALVGFVGLKPTLYTLENNLLLALANKESLVAGGELVNDLLKQGKGKLYPIDSEHVAINKCLAVNDHHVDKIVLTASGGAFRHLNREQLVNVTPSDALKHPTWKMGAKITIDCATMVNKAFELIEAHYLFDCPISKLAIKMHDESRIHSYVIYKNGQMRLDEGKPDMRQCIKYALYETLIDYQTVVVDSLNKFKNYHFADFDNKRYPMVKYAKTVIEKKGTFGAAFNAANEEAVRAFLDYKIAFLDIETIIDKVMKHHQNKTQPSYEDIALADTNARILAHYFIRQIGGHM